MNNSSSISSNICFLLACENSAKKTQMKAHQSRGQIRVGRITTEKKKKVMPSFPSFKPIVVMTPKSPYGKLGPYVLKNNDVLVENEWQFSKVYPRVKAIKVPYSQWDRRIIWEHGEEVHVNTNDEPNDAYWAWRKKGMATPDAVRYPNGHANRRSVLYSIKGDSNQRLSYIEARKEIYLPIYINAVVKEEQFKELQKRLDNGENLLLIEVDGPHEESLTYYKDEYGVDSSFIEKNTILATEENLKIMLEDDTHSFGHGYCLAAALEGFDLCDAVPLKKSKLE
jgi:hypothetical protein